jgi:hypothetical protein
MTTIAYRAGIMAADTAVFDRGCYCGQATKIFRTIDGRLGGVTGCMGDSTAFRDWFTAGADGEPPEFKDEESEGVIAYPDGRVEWIGHGRKRYAFENAEFHALGSGFRIAMGALHAGMDAVRAIEIACDLDNNTRRPIIVLRHFEEER